MTTEPTLTPAAFATTGPTANDAVLVADGDLVDLHNLESGRSAPRLDTLTRIADAYHTTVATLVSVHWGPG